MSQATRRVMLVEDEAFTRSLIEALLTGADFEVATCADAGAARRRLEEFEPDLVILDVNLGGGPTGLQLGFVLEHTRPDVPLMYLTRYPTALLSARDGAEHLADKVIVHKDEITDAGMLIEAVEATMRGQHPKTPVVGDEQVRGLTATQLEILKLMSSGMTNAAIARQRSTTERAVEKQVKSIYQALELEPNQHTNARVLAALRYADAMGESLSVDESAVHA